MSELRVDAIGLAYPPQRHSVTPAEVGPTGGWSLVDAIRWVGSARELSDPRVSPRPVRLWDHISGGALEMRAGDASISAGDEITTVGRIADATHNNGIDRIALDVAITNPTADIVAEGRFVLIVPAAGRSAPMPARRSEDTDPRSAVRRTAMARYDFVRVIPADGRFAREVEGIAVSIETLIRELCGGVPARLRSVSCVVGVPTTAGGDVIVHGRRDRKHPGVIQFEAIDRAGNVVVADGVARMTP